MELDGTSCYGALKARDGRFDGRFFVGVLTTGIYCRPVCPARTPLRRNVRFYVSAAAAGEAGFRPCLRCRPETAPGTPAWRGTSATVTRAVRLLGEGALDRGGVEGLAQQLGIGERHLRRLFRDQLGASPVAVAQTKRLHFAKKLIDETELAMTEVAFTAGYSSVRRFNTAVRDAYGRSPSQLREARRGRRSSRPARSRARTSAGPEPVAKALELELAYRPPLAWSELLEFLALRAIPGVEQVADHAYRRTIEVGDTAGVLEVRASPSRNALVLRVPIALSRSLVTIVDRVRRIFDLDSDPIEIQQQLGADPQLRGALERSPGLRVPGAWDGFELAVRAILGQQVSVARASDLSGALVRAFGRPLAAPLGADGLDHLFPEPERLADADVASIGLPKMRGKAIRELARAVCDGRVELTPGFSPESSEERLTALPGIGPWTARYIAMRALREPDAFPRGDLVLRRVAASEAKPLTEGQLEAVSEAWRPWRAYAVIALWRSA